MRPTRRSVLKSLLAAPPAIIFAGSITYAWGQASELAPTPVCDDGSAQTPRQTAGPFYKPSSPRRSDLTADAGDRQLFSLRGFVLDTNCRPIPEAMVEIWHADEQGRYDNSGFLWRAHQFTDASGRWGFDTILTEHYSFRTAHYHFRVQRPDGDTLITQLYFPDHPRNSRDRLFDPQLMMALSEEGRVGRFDFILPRD